MSVITKLPYELVASVLRKFDNVRFLPPSILTCRHFYSSYKEHPDVKYEVLRRQVTSDLLPYAVAVMEASRLPHPLTGASIQGILDALYNEPAKLVTQLRTVPLPVLLKMGQTHDVIQSLAADFATDAWTLLSQTDPGVSGNLVLSPKESFRFRRAFYRVELFFNLYRSRGVGLSDSFSDSDYRRFLSKHPPWENEQLGCVHDYLEKKFSEASFDVVAHDIEFGELSIDYLTLGGENTLKQRWISQGVDFIYRLMNETSYDNKKALLKSPFGAGGAFLCDALCTSPYGPDNGLLEGYTEEEIQALVPRRDDQDACKGPYNAWYSVHRFLPRGAWVMFSGTAGLRERAYVLWDLDRLEEHSMLDLFESVPENPSHIYTDEDFNEMRDSFDKRSEIWQSGGSGYWSKGDNRNIVWPGKSTLQPAI